MLAQQGLKFLGLLRGGLHLLVGRFDEFSRIPCALHRLPRPMQLVNVVVGLPESFVSLLLGLFHVFDRCHGLLCSGFGEWRRGPPAAQQLHQVLVAPGTHSLLQPA